MKWFTKLIFVLVAVLLLGSVFGFIFILRARTQATEYRFQIDALLQAALIANEEQPLTDADKAVVAEYGGQRTVVVPGNYAALAYYLERDAVSPPWGRPDPDRSLHIRICDLAELYVSPADKTGEKVLIWLKEPERSIVVHVRGGNQWQSLLDCCMTGTYHDANIPLG